MVATVQYIESNTWRPCYIPQYQQFKVAFYVTVVQIFWQYVAHSGVNKWEVELAVAEPCASHNTASVTVSSLSAGTEGRNPVTVEPDAVCHASCLFFLI